MNKRVLPSIPVIAGPTASGKTFLALKIAEIIPIEIVSADSRQVYRHLDIGTAKPSKEELTFVPHHFINIREPNEQFNAGDFQESGRKIISEILLREKIPLVVGGTGLYIRALIDGFFEQPDFSGNIRRQLEDRLNKEGKESLFKELQSVDPVSASSMDATKFRRVIRALEVYNETGVPISQFHSSHTPEHVFDPHFIGLAWDRSTLYQRINFRVDQMIERGFLDEVKGLASMGFDDRLQALQTIGYKEAFAFLRNEISMERMVDLMKQNTRRFAKRQLTWFRKENRIQWYTIDSEKDLLRITSEIVKKIKNQI